MSNESLQMMAGGGEMCDSGLLLATSGGSSVPITSVEMQLATGLSGGWEMSGQGLLLAGGG